MREAKSTDKMFMKAAILLAVLLIVAAMVWNADAEKKKSLVHNKEHARQVVTMMTATKITANQAINTALNHFPGSVIEVTLEKLHDKTLWDVEILTIDQAILVVRIDAELGLVLATEEKVAGKKQEHEEI